MARIRVRSNRRTSRSGRSRDAPARLLRMPRQAPPCPRSPSSHRLTGLVAGAAMPCEQVCARLKGVPYDICIAECRRLAARLT